MFGSMIVKAILLSVTTAAASYFITQSSILDRPRFWVIRHSPFFGGLVTCGYCLSHWIAATLVMAYQVKIFSLWWPLDYALTILTIAWVASIQYSAGVWLWDAISRGEEEKK